MQNVPASRTAWNTSQLTTYNSFQVALLNVVTVCWFYTVANPMSGTIGWLCTYVHPIPSFGQNLSFSQCQCQEWGLEAKVNQTTQLQPGELFFLQGKRNCPGWDFKPTDTLNSRQVLYHLSYQGNSAGRGVQISTQRQNLKQLCYSPHVAAQCTAPPLKARALTNCNLGT
jgi:hypothetical protein